MLGQVHGSGMGYPEATLFYSRLHSCGPTCILKPRLWSVLCAAVASCKVFGGTWGTAGKLICRATHQERAGTDLVQPQAG